MVLEIITIILPCIYSSSLVCLLGMILCQPTESDEFDKKQYQPVSKLDKDDLGNDVEYEKDIEVSNNNDIEEISDTALNQDVEFIDNNYIELVTDTEINQDIELEDNNAIINKDNLEVSDIGNEVDIDTNKDNRVEINDNNNQEDIELSDKEISLDEDDYVIEFDCYNEVEL